MLFFRVRHNSRLFSSLSLIWQPLFKVWLCCFLPRVHKISHCCIIFCTGSQCRRYGRAQGRCTPLNDCLCPPISVYSYCFFGASRCNDKISYVTISYKLISTRQQAIMEKGIVVFKHNEVFSVVCKIADHQQLLYIKFRENLPNSQKYRGPTQSGRSQGSQR